MPNFDSGVKSYIVGQATIHVSFPVSWRDEADVRCEMCQYYSRQARSCRLNGKIVEYPDKYIGSHCPLEFYVEEENSEDVIDS